LLVVASIKNASSHSRRNAKIETAMAINTVATAVSPMLLTVHINTLNGGLASSCSSW